jgi:stage III sporulation protein AG
VIIVAKGGDNGTVVTQITEAVEALLGLPAHKIKVLKMS